MPLLLTTQTENNTSNNTPLYQRWSPITDVLVGDSINKIELYYNIQYPSTLPSYDFIVRIRDYNTTFFPMYSQFKMVIIKEDVVGSFESTLDWLVQSFSNGINLNQDIILQEGMTTAVNLDLNSNTFFQENIYKKNIIFYVYGKTATDEWELIPGKYIIQIELTVENQEISIVPSRIKLNHYRNVAVIPVNITVTAPALYTWELIAENPNPNPDDNSNLELSSNDSSVTIINMVSNGYKAQGTGTKTLQINVRAAYWNTLITNQFKLRFIKLNQYVDANTSIIKKIIFVNINYLIDATVLYLSTESILFNAEKQISEPTPVLVDIYSLSSFTIVNQPPWLVINTVDSNTLSIVPMPTLSMEPGIYNGVVTISNAYQTKIISIQYLLQGGIILPVTNGINFTLDQDYIIFNSLYSNTYFELLMKVSVFQNNNLLKEHHINTLIPLLNKKGKMNIGKIVHRLMSAINFDNIPRFYKPANVELIINEKQDNQVLATYNYNQQFIAGKTNKNISPSRAIGYLDIYEGTTRVFKNTNYPLNIYSESYIYNLGFYKNGVLAFNYSITLQKQIYDSNFLFAFYNPGDEVEIKITNGNETISKKFICFPEPIQKYVIGYENDYKLLSIMECTGELSLSSEYKYFTNVKYENLVETLENVSNERQTKLTIHTGFILKEEHQVIDAILRSPRCRLFKNENLTTGIDIVPVSKEIVEMSTDQSLYSFKLEFIINRTHHEKVYSI